MFDDVDRAMSLIEEHADRARFVGPRDERVIAAAEGRLGVRFPATYRRFLLRLGAGSFGAAEFYGVIAEDFSGPLPDGVWVTLTSRAGPAALPSSMVVIGEDGMGGYYVLDTAADDEPPVVVWNGGDSEPGDPLETVAPDFGAFILDCVTVALAHG